VKHTRIIVSHYGGPDALRVVEEERPEPKHGEVRVRVLAAGVALPDVMAREGIHPETPPVPYTPGWDLVGEVERLGDGVSAFAPGQIVALFSLLQQQKIQPLIAQRFPLAEARRAHELLEKGGVIGKIVLVCNGSWR
jgi:NADPH:quinone reductase-like Zn-dependent oxidoreductase